MLIKRFNIFRFVRFLVKNNCKNIIHSYVIYKNSFFISFDYLDRSYYGFLNYDAAMYVLRSKKLSDLFELSSNEDVF